MSPVDLHPRHSERDWFANKHMRESDGADQIASACSALLTSTLRALEAFIGKAKKRRPHARPSAREPRDVPNWPPLF